MHQSLKRSIEEALRAFSPLRTSKAEIAMAVDDGKVTLSGYVPSDIIKRMAAVLSSSVQGVSEVVNDLASDPALERAVAMALAADNRTRPWPIRVRSELGYVQLQGNVPDEATAQAALEVARQVEGPRQVVNALQVKQPAPLAA